jgi:beta-galactosidase
MGCFVLLPLLCLCQTAGREQILLDGPWKFITSADAPDADDSAWETVTVPHTWNTVNHRTYHRCWYRTHFNLGRDDAGRRIALCFEGVGAVAEVFVNGGSIGSHRGAFTRFTLEATPQARPGDNVLAVRVSNDPEDTADCLPSGLGKQLYHVYGGIYRKVWLIKTAPAHLDGLYLTARAPTLSIRAGVRRAAGASVRVRVLDRDGRETLALEKAVQAETVEMSGTIPNPRLWSPADPYLYSVRAELWLNGQCVDSMVERTGFREFTLKNGEFCLNGRPIMLRGVCKHQETEAHASAVEDRELREDFALMKELGVNCVRLVHYPHAALEYDLADELGLLVVAENGNSNFREEVDGTETGDEITREMVRQNYNHPSIVMWSVGDEAGFHGVERYAAVVRSEDATRLVTYCSDSRGPRGTLDVLCRNLYPGWYRGDVWDLDGRFISEAGAGGVVTTHGEDRHVVDRYEPEESQLHVLEGLCQQARSRDLPMVLIWAFRDFRIDKYKDKLNTKGLLTYAGAKKDGYSLVQSFLRPDLPVVHLAGKTWFLRPEGAVKAYSNRAALTLQVNGRTMGTRKNGEFRHDNGRAVENVFVWRDALRPGRNEVSVDDGQGHADSCVIYVGAPEPAGLVRKMESSNPRNPAYFIDMPVQPQGPFYYEFDGTADNSFGEIPEALAGARWIATRRLSKDENGTDLSFTLSQDADVFIMFTARRRVPPEFAEAGFVDAGLSGMWRDNDLERVPFKVVKRGAKAGEEIEIEDAEQDYVVLIKSPASARRRR